MEQTETLKGKPELELPTTAQSMHVIVIYNILRRDILRFTFV